MYTHWQGCKAKCEKKRKTNICLLKCEKEELLRLLKAFFLKLRAMNLISDLFYCLIKLSVESVDHGVLCSISMAGKHAPFCMFLASFVIGHFYHRRAVECG